jgi:hypothetical protein
VCRYPSFLRPVHALAAGWRPSTIHPRLWGLGGALLRPANHQSGSSGPISGFQPTANSGFPGSSVISTLSNGIGWWALVASFLALVIGAAAWALGSHTNNYQYSTAGRRAVIIAGLAALVIGAAPAFVNFLFNEGNSLNK